MKNIFFILIILLTVSCSKDERNCSSCHIVVYQLNYPYYITELEEFCDEELLINQNNGFLILNEWRGYMLKTKTKQLIKQDLVKNFINFHH